MLIINPASATGIGYWQRSAVASYWLGGGATVLGLAGEVETADLRSVMLGRGPSTGQGLTARPGLRRRHGWDLIFAAPKSVSLLAEAGSVPANLELRRAYRRAVSDAVEVLEGRAAWLRAGGAQVPAEGVVAAAFEHIANDAGHPHLHTHLVLANLAARGEGPWGCLIGNELWRWREGIGAGFHLALRSRLAEAGFGLRWAVSDGGLGEIASVPVEARSVASSRSRGLRASARSFGSGSAATERNAQARTRQSARSPGAAIVGWDAAKASQVLRRALGEPAPPSPPPAAASVAAALAARGSAFGEADVLVALAETSPSGLNLQQATDWARNWCEASRPVPAARKRWTTTLADHLDGKVVELATEGRFAHMAQVMPELAASELTDLGTPSAVAAEAMRLACGPDGVAIVPRGPWLVQAACIDGARAAWQAAGMTVRVACPSELSARRWRALTSLQEGSSNGMGISAAPGGDRRGRVLVVDAADHLSPAHLARLLDQAATNRTKVVLVLGGTVPGHGPSLARSLDELADGLVEGLAEGLAEGRYGAGTPYLPPAGWAPLGAAANPAVSLPGLAVHGALTGSDAMREAVRAWAGTATAHVVPPLMVGFGPAEAEALNLAARPLWLGLLARTGPAATAGAELARADQAATAGAELALGERRYAVGDRVVALRRIGRATSSTLGSVVSLGVRSLTVEWQGPGGAWPGELGPEHGRSLGYGYATTVPYLRSSDRTGEERFVVLGDPLELAARSERALGAWVTVPGPGWPAFGTSGHAARHRAALSELATSWPDREMLELAGPRPLGVAGRRRWAEIVISCAVRRELGLSPAGLVRRDLADLGRADLGVAGLGVPDRGVPDRGAADLDRPRPGAPRLATPSPGSGRSGRRSLTWQEVPSPHMPGL